MINKTSIKDRAISISTAILIHVLLLFFVVFTIKTAVNYTEERSPVMKIADIREELPPPQTITSASTEIVAEVMFESDDAVTGDRYSGAGDAINFLPAHLVSHMPVFSEEEIKRKTIYPPIAQRSGIEGTVYLDIFVDREGTVLSVTILKEDPPDRGFGEAAQKAFLGLKGSPAMANGQEVAVHYRYPVRFTLK